MQYTFRCHLCGTQNFIGEGQCAGCGQLLPYTCPTCGYPINSTFTNCPYCHLALNWPNRQQSRNIYGDPTASQCKSSSLFACSMCGTQNVIGVKLCRKCHQRFNYTCPTCNAWVDNTFVNCPNCRRPLQWPAEKELQGKSVKNSAYRMDEAYYEETRKPKKEVTWPVVVLGAGLLFIIAFGLITAISPSTMTVAKPAAVHAVSDVPTTSKQPTISTPSNSSPTSSSQPNNPPTEASKPSTPAPVSSTATTTPGTGAWNTTADNYLQNLDPKWGTPAAPDPNCPLCTGNSRVLQSQGQELLTK